MTVQDTSLCAYIMEVPSLGEHQAEVRNALLRLGCGTNKELATLLGWPINSVTPRIQELRKMGLVSCILNRPHLTEEHQGCACKIIQGNDRPAIQWRVIQKRW